MGENREKNVFVISRKKKNENGHIDLSYKIIETDFKDNPSLSFLITRM